MTLPLVGRQILVTGASEGLGAAIAATLVGQGASVFLCARSAGPLEALAGRLAASAPDQTVAWASCDVSEAAAVAELVGRVRATFPDLDGLINNAGIVGPIGPMEGNDLDQWQATIRTNVFGPLFTCSAVLPHFKARRRGKIVNISGGGATQPMPCFSAYAASKAALVRLTETLAEETKGFGITVNAVAPGALATRLNHRVLEVGAERVGVAYHARLAAIVAEGGMSMDTAAALCAWLCSGASDGITGRLIAAQWDSWRALPAHAEELAETDIYTLRRIVPSDRGKRWDG